MNETIKKYWYSFLDFFKNEQYEQPQMNREFIWVAPLIFSAGVSIAYFLGYLLAHFFSNEINWWVPVGAIMLWMAFYLNAGYCVLSNRSYLVIERFGSFTRIAHSGPRILCFPGLIDMVVAEGTLRTQSRDLFTDEKSAYVVDFKGGISAPIKAKVWYHVAPEEGGQEEIDEAIYRFTYSLNNEDAARERLEDVLESSCTPLLQALTLDQALEKKDVVSTNATSNEVKEALSINGIYLIEKKAFLITDIVLPPEIIELREEIAHGEVEALKQEAMGKGYIGTILGIIKLAAKEGKEVTLEYARSIYETQRGLETVKGSQMTFFANDIKNVLLTVGVGKDSTTNTGEA